MQVDEESILCGTIYMQVGEEAMYSMRNNLYMQVNEEAMYSMRNNLHASG